MNLVKLCLKDNYDPCPWRRKRHEHDGVRISRSVHRCANPKGCVWEYWGEVCEKLKKENKL